MSTLATKYDLRAYAGAVLDQGNIGSCMPNSLVSGIDLIMRLAGKEIDPLSRLQNYADTRNAMGSFSRDSGSIPEYSLDAAKNKGIAYESSWEYTNDNLYKQPTVDVYAEASGMKLSGWTALNIYQSDIGYVNSVKAALSEGKPVILGFMVRYSFFSLDGPLYSQQSLSTDAYAGGHAVLIVGYDDNLNGGSYIIKNSWGTEWGDNGYGAISYKQFSPRPITFEDPPDLVGLWTLDGVNNMNLVFTTERVTMAQEYAIILGRAPEVVGMDWWAGHLKLGDVTKADLADMLLASSEALAMYGSETNAEFVQSMYENVLGRNADSGGLQWWTEKLNSGVSRGTLANYLMDTVSTSSNDILAHDYLANKTHLSSYISIALQYDGKHDNVVKTAISSVTYDANYTEVIKIGLAEALHE